jgi:hypothetical protein
MRSRSFSPCLAALPLPLLVLLLLLLPLVAAGCHRRGQRQENAQAGAATPRPAASAEPAATAPRSEENLACRLLTRDDAEALFGGPVQPRPVTSTMADVGEVSWRCGYISETTKPQGPTNPTKVVTLLVKRWQQPAAARSAFEHAHALAQAISGQVPENVDGLGERAYWAGGKVNQLNVLAGNDWLVISGTQGPGVDELAPARAAAARVLAHH